MPQAELVTPPRKRTVPDLGDTVQKCARHEKKSLQMVASDIEFLEKLEVALRVARDGSGGLKGKLQAVAEHLRGV